MIASLAVLLVEKNPEMLEFYADSFRHLAKDSYGLCCVATPDEALEVGRQTDVEIGVLITDLYNQGIDGYALLQRMKEVQPKIQGVLVSLCPKGDPFAAGFSRVFLKDFPNPKVLSQLQVAVIELLVPGVKRVSQAQIARDLALECAERTLTRK